MTKWEKRAIRSIVILLIFVSLACDFMSSPTATPKPTPTRRPTLTPTPTLAQLLVGVWHTDESDGMDWEFTKDGQFKITIMEQNLDAGTYQVDGNKITLNISLYGEETTEEVTVVIEGNGLTLTVSTGESVTFTRVR
jgi:uncharacterized protein (TIGR03066 family)